MRETDEQREARLATWEKLMRDIGRVDLDLMRRVYRVTSSEFARGVYEGVEIAKRAYRTQSAGESRQEIRSE